MFNIFEEISWPQFTQLPSVAKLSLNEQVQHYNQYLYQLSEARTSWIVYQNKGPRGIVNIGLLAQEEYDSASEDYFLVLQEDGSGIFVTKYID
jgi:phospholipase C